MPSAKKTITVRLAAAELAALKKLPGGSDAARLRMLIHATGATDGLSAKIGAEVSKKLAVLLVRSLAESESRNDQNFRRALDAFAAQLSPFLSKILSNTTR